MVPLYQDEWFTFRFTERRIIASGATGEASHLN
jgi:hypothetical protein